ncbi:MAG: anaerobic ribonucleoside-triphosphate reductase [Candidatus Bathyarchaeia archaeon]
MAIPFEKSGVDILNAASSPVRMRILKLLKAKGPLPYTEVMSALGLDPIRDAGKFVYHLKSVTGANLVTLDRKSKKYMITELGEMVVNFERDLEEYVAAKKGKLYVRTSRLSVEEFEREKIVNSLVNEAGVPYELAQEIAAEAEERLLRLRTSYLTAPLIREFINSILIEKRLEDYRHKLTRLGMPVHDVSQLLKRSSEKMLSAQAVKEAAGNSVIEEYVLLNFLPRNIADSHLSGDLHIHNLGGWILKPDEVIHDLRIFLKNGLPAKNPPRNLYGALAIAQLVYQLAKGEVVGEQCFDMFNVFLAPYALKTSKEDVKNVLYEFFTNIRGDSYSQDFSKGLSLGFELSIPNFLSNVEAIGPGGSNLGKYSDYEESAFEILEASIEAAIEASIEKPLFNPRFIFKIRNPPPKDKRISNIMLKIHQFAAKSFLPYFATLEGDEEATYTATGLRIDNTWTGDWEEDCLKTGNVGTVLINLPRAAYESHRKLERLQKIIEEKMNLAAEALYRKSEEIKERLQQLLPLLSGGSGGSYFIEKNSTYTISPIGLNEAVKTFIGSSLSDGERALELAANILEDMRRLSQEASKKFGIRIALAQRPQDEASVRLAKLDVARYGPGKMATEGIRDYPYYTDLFAVPLSERIGLQERILLESRFQAYSSGGHLASIHLPPAEQDPKRLMDLTDQICNSKLRFFTYTNSFIYCRRCNRTFLGTAHTCPKCASINPIVLSRSSATYLPIELWPDAKRRDMESRTIYSIS